MLQDGGLGGIAAESWSCDGACRIGPLRTLTLEHG